MDRKKKFFITIILIFSVMFNLFLHKQLLKEFISKEENSNVFLPNGNFLKIFSVDFSKPIIADFYWIKLIGNLDISKKDKETGEKLYKYTLLITDLDPYFYLPYILGGSYLTEKDRFNMFRRGSVILKKGIKFLPEKWQLSFLLGYLSFFEQNNVKQGLKYLKKCLILKTTPSDIKKLIRFIIMNFSFPETIR